MCAQAVIAVDGPNVLVTMGKLFGREAKLDHFALKAALLEDARTRLGTDEFKTKAAVFLQSHGQDGPTEGRARFEGMLSGSGWKVFTKPPVDYPADLVAVSRGLDDALGTRGYQAVREVKRALRELDAARDAECDCIADTAVSTLRESVRTLTKVYAIHYALSTRMVLRVVLPLLVRLTRFKRPRSLLERLLIDAWSNISQAERGQAEYIQRVREHLAAAYASQLDWPSKERDVQADPHEMSNAMLMDRAHRARRALAAQRDELHRAGDVDDLLSTWTRSQIMPALNGAPNLPAVVYLVGNDYRNHLPLAERLRRYGAQVVLVLQPCHLARTPVDKQSEVGRYPLIRLDTFVDVGCAKRVAA